MNLSSNPGAPGVARASGLDDIVFAETLLSEVDGARGRLSVRGYPIEQLTGHIHFEALCALLWDGALPSPVRERELRRELGRARLRAHARLGATLAAALTLDDPMDALRAGVALLPSDAGLGHDEGTALDIVATVGVLLAAWARRRRAELPIEPNPELSHAEDLLRLLGVASDPARARALDSYLVTVAEHGMNASTFTARVVASTASDSVSAVTAGISALKGKLHGGAPGPVLDMLDAIAEEQNARDYLTRALAGGERIMGMGHRIYRVRDPRAEVLERATLELAEGAPAGRVALARAVERIAEELLAARHPERKLCANVEFFTAVLLEAVGVPRELFTATFAAARVAGFLAHIAEQRRAGRIVRPSSRYVGPEFEAGDHVAPPSSVAFA